MENYESYITLKEISEILGENYSTIRHYKREFNVYVDARLFGRQIRYSSQNIDLFREILGFKEDGCTNMKIEKMLQDKKIKRQEDKQVSEQAAKQVSKQVSEEASKEASEQVSEEVSEQVSEEASKEASEQVSEQVSNEASKQAASKMAQGIYKKIKRELDSDIQNKIQKQINSTEPAIDKYLEKLTEKINAALSGIQKTHQENLKTFSQGITMVNQRVISMETELGLPPGRELKIEIPEPENIKITVDRLRLSDQTQKASAGSGEKKAGDLVIDKNLEAVLKSIEKGKPDKDAVVGWVLSERNKKPCPSYADLAAKLDNAAVSTLSGRGGWNRSSLSKMILERDKGDKVNLSVLPKNVAVNGGQQRA